MKKKVIGIIVVIAVIVAVIFTIKQTNGEATEGNLTSNGELTVYIVSGENNMKYWDVLNNYESKYPDVKINTVKFDNYDEYLEQLSNDLLVGEGPDVIYTYNGSIEKITKLIQSNTFLDLTGLLENDESINMDDYNKVVMDSGIFDGKRVIVPFDYYLYGYMSTEENMKEDNIDLNGTATINDMALAVNDLLNEDKYKNNEKYLSDYLSCDSLLNYQKNNFINYDDYSVNFDTDEYRELLESYKTIASSYADDELIEEYTYDKIKMLKDNKIDFATSFYNYGYILYLYNYAKKEENINLKFFYNINEGMASVNSMLAINSKSKNQKEAYNFIKLAISENYQSKSEYIDGFPVNNKALDKQIETAKENIGQYAGDYKLDALPDDMDKELMDAKDNIKYSCISDESMNDIIFDIVQKYFADEITLDETISELNDKVSVYLKE